MMLINTGVVPFINPARLDDMVSSEAANLPRLCLDDLFYLIYLFLL